MIHLPPGILIVVALAVGVSILAMLHVFSCIIKHEVTLHDLRNHVEKLHNDYALHLAKMSGEVPEEEFEVQIIDPETDEPEISESETPLEVAEQAPEPAGAEPSLEEEPSVQAA